MNTDKYSVLVVDDEPAIRQILCRSIGSAGFGVAQATDGVDALRQMERQPFDIVVTDIGMPNMDGMELLTKIRRHYSRTYVVLITGQRAALVDSKVREAGADDLISKPFRNVDIIRKLKQLLQSGSPRKARVAPTKTSVQQNADPADQTSSK